MVLKHLAAGVAANAYGQAISIVAQVISVPVLVAAWGKDGLGLWSMLTAIPFLLLPMDFGYAAAAAGVMAPAVARHQFRDALITFQSALFAVGLIAIAILVVAVGLYAWLPRTYENSLGGIRPEMLRIAAAAMPFLACYVAVSLMSGMVNAVYRVNGRYALGTSIFETGRLAENLAVAGAALYGASIVHCAAIMLGSRVVFTSLSSILMVRVTPWIRFGMAEATHRRWRELRRPAAAAMLVPVAVSMSIQGITVLVGLLLTPAAAGVFSVVRVLYRTLVQFVGSFTRAAMPQFATAVATGDDAAQSKLGAMTLCVIAIVAGIGTLFLLVFGQRIVEVWTAGHIAPPFGLFVAMSAHAWLASTWAGMSNLLLAVNLQEEYARRVFLVTFGGLIASLLVIPVLGVTGAGVALAIIDASAVIIVLRVWIANPNLRLKRSAAVGKALVRDLLLKPTASSDSTPV